MPLHQNPANTRLATDLKIYRRKIKKPSKKNPDSAKDIRRHLHKKNPIKYPNPAPNDDDILTGEAFRDLTSWQSATAYPIPNRMGGGLDDTTPVQFLPWSIKNPDGLPDLPQSANPEKIEWAPPDHSKIKVDILPGGIVQHTDPTTGLEMHDAHHFMHGIFSQILYKLRDLFEAINKALEAYANVVSDDEPANAQAATYKAAVEAFETYAASLQPGGGSTYSSTFNFVSINPVVTNEGFIISCRVKMNWKNPYHSSSTIRIP
jgi:hypothetical protein